MIWEQLVALKVGKIDREQYAHGNKILYAKLLRTEVRESRRQITRQVAARGAPVATREALVRTSDGAVRQRRRTSEGTAAAAVGAVAAAVGAVAAAHRGGGAFVEAGVEVGFVGRTEEGRQRLILIAVDSLADKKKDQCLAAHRKKKNTPYPRTPYTHTKKGEKCT